MLIMASTLHRTPLDQLVNPGEVDRVRDWDSDNRFGIGKIM